MKFSYWHLIKSTLSIIVLTWFIFSLIIYFNQKNLIYVPSKEYISTPEFYNLDYENHLLLTSDGERINSWWIPHENSRATLLFFHGNGGNISTRIDSINIFHQLKLSVFIIDYRGYGNSSGYPSEEGTYIDAETALHFLKNKKTYRAKEGGCPPSPFGGPQKSSARFLKNFGTWKILFSSEILYLYAGF